MSRPVGVILVNYKDYAVKYLKDCRDSLRVQDYDQANFRVYVVDNESSPESRRYLSENYPEAKIILRSDGNYAAANNAGLKQAEQDGCAYFVIANLDATFDVSWLKELVKAVASAPQIGLAQSKILLYPKNQEEWQRPRLNSLGNIIHFLGFGFTSGYNQPDRKIKGLPEITGYPSGCSMIVKKEVIDKIGGYNEEYYMYHDDLELGLKARLAGYRIVLAPRSVAYHKYDFKRSVRMLYYMERNRYLAILTFYQPLTLALISPALLAMEIGLLSYALAKGWLKIKIKADLYFLQPAKLKKIIKARRVIKQWRCLPERQAVGNFSGRILFQEIDNPLVCYLVNPVFNFYWRLVKKLIVW